MAGWIWVLVGTGVLISLVGLVGLGFWLGGGGRRTEHARFWPTAEARQLAQLAHALTGLVQSVAQDVDQHQSQIKQANEGLRALTTGGTVLPESSPSAWAALVLKTVAEIVQVNERLQHRLQQAEEKLQQQAQQIQTHLAEARTDPLTGLPNRRAFDDELVRRLAEWKRKGALFCLLLVDVDHFKQLNDQYGHPTGDYLLRQLGELLQTAVREMDLVARIGGEEFAILLPSTNLPDAMRVAQRVRAAVVDSPLEVASDQRIRMTVSLGLTAVRPGDHPLLILRRADQALYTAKQAGRDCGFYHDGHTCRPIPMCFPADRLWMAGVPWHSSPDGDSDLLESHSPSRSEIATPLAPNSPDSMNSSNASDLEAAFQTACQSLRNQLAALAQPDFHNPPSPSTS
ncbi:MAG: GGDEF domain-containing protein [Thermoguttaceae bacterium]|nr:GGDEF domain-containing protein [Thermoguttaceae bacterium]MDW8037085.1 GGDEF domain-containing protein [Thermoguttaceae bacterium]